MSRVVYCVSHVQHAMHGTIDVNMHGMAMHGIAMHGTPCRIRVGAHVQLIYVIFISN